MLAGPAMNVSPVVVVAQQASPMIRMSLQDLGATVARPPVDAWTLSSGALVFSSPSSAQTIATGGTGIMASVTNSGMASINQAAVSVSFTLAQPPAASPRR
jgi:hypothetical protein